MNLPTSNFKNEFPFVVQAWSSLDGWQDSKYGGQTIEEACENANKLRWMPGDYEHKVRIVKSK